MPTLGLSKTGWLVFVVLVVAALPNAPSNVGGLLGVLVMAYIVGYGVTRLLANDPNTTA